MYVTWITSLGVPPPDIPELCDAPRHLYHRNIVVDTIIVFQLDDGHVKDKFRIEKTMTRMKPGKLCQKTWVGSIPINL